MVGAPGRRWLIGCGVPLAIVVLILVFPEFMGTIVGASAAIIFVAAITLWPVLLVAAIAFVVWLIVRRRKA